MVIHLAKQQFSLTQTIVLKFVVGLWRWLFFFFVLEI